MSPTAAFALALAMSFVAGWYCDTITLWIARQLDKALAGFSIWRLRRYWKKHPPQGPDQMPQHFNCRCQIIRKIEDDE